MKQSISPPRLRMEEQKAERLRHSPERTCLGCGAQRQAREFLRFVRAPSGEILLDTLSRAPGRGVYVCCDLLCLREALHAVKLTYAFRQPVIGPDLDDLCQEVRRMLYRRLGFCLSMGQKRGEIVSGYVSLQKALLQTRILYVILAADIAVKRAEEYQALCAQRAIPCVTLFTKDVLGRMLGRPSRSAVGFTDTHLLEVLRSTLISLARLQTIHSAVEAQADFF